MPDIITSDDDGDGDDDGFFCRMVDQRTIYSLISSRDHWQRSSSSRISDRPPVGFVPMQNISSGFFE